MRDKQFDDFFEGFNENERKTVKRALGVGIAVWAFSALVSLALTAAVIWGIVMVVQSLT